MRGMAGRRAVDGGARADVDRGGFGSVFLAVALVIELATEFSDAIVSDDTP